MVIPSFGMIAPELVLIVIAIFMLMVSGFVSVRNALYINALFTVLSLILAFLVFGSMHSTKPVTFMDMVQINSFIVFVNQVILIASLIAYLLSIQWLRTLPHGSAEYSSLFLMATAGLMLVVSSSHFLSFYVAVEMASLCMYVMAAYERDDLHSTEAGIKYFVLGSLASAIMLFGISLIYGFAGTLSFDALPQAIHGHSSSLYVIIIGLVLVLVGLCFKLSLTPFHMWTPDVYNGAPTPVVAFFAMVPKIAIMSFLLNLTIHVFGEIGFYWKQVLLVAAAGSMIVGAFAGLVQQHLKRLIAYSSIGHMGYALLGATAATSAGVQAVLFYLFIYMVMSAGLFACLILLKKEGKEVKTVSDLAGLSATHPKIALSLALLMFSMAGIPPFIGFFAKMFIFTAALQAGYVSVVVIAALSSVIACFYYIRIVKLMYFDEVTGGAIHTDSRTFTGYILFLSIFMNVIVFRPELLMAPAKEAAMVLFP